MSKRKSPKITNGLYRFIQGISAHYHDKGMPLYTAKAKMLDETYETVRSITKVDKEIPDHLLVITMEHAVKSLQQRGYTISQKLQKETDAKQIEVLRTALQQMKKVMDEINNFISVYRGEHNGNEE